MLVIHTWFCQVGTCSSRVIWTGFLQRKHQCYTTCKFPLKFYWHQLKIDSVIKQKQSSYSKKKKKESSFGLPQIQKSLFKDKYIEQSSISSIWLKKDSSWFGSFRKSKIKIQKCYSSQLHKLPKNLMNLMYQMLFLLSDKIVPKSDSNSPAIWVTYSIPCSRIVTKGSDLLNRKRHYVGINYWSPQTRKESKNRSYD